ncbi:MAG TPA: AAA family ATPase [Bacillales bacterium]|nr:AAA family ATPase [Bacillales bacterium]
MRIRNMHLYRYGMFQDAVFHFPSGGVQVVYGMNEAGKSTMMRFIRDILFGFSSDSPGISDDGATFGGRLALEFPEFGNVTIERTGNRGSGTAKVELPDGQTAGEEAIGEWLPGLDAAMFRAIFCFDLDGLEGLEKIKADELNDYLFHAGMTGDFSIRAIEKKLAKKQDEWFKPRGQKPLLNQKLSELESLEKDVAEWRQKNDSYQELTAQSEDLGDRIAEFRERAEHHKKKIRWLERQKVLAPYVREKQEAESRLKQLPAYEPFPEDGLTRFDHWKTQAVALEAELAELEEKRRAAEEKADGIDIREEWLDAKAEVRHERDQERLMQSRMSEKAAQQEAVRGEEAELAALMEQLGPAWTEERIAAADTGLAAKEMLKKHVAERTKLTQRQDMLEAEMERAERALRESEAEVESAEAKRLEEGKRERLEQSLRMHEEMERKQREKVELEHQVSRSGTSVQMKSVVFYGGTGLGTALVIWMIFSGQWVAGAAAALLTAAFALYLHRSGGDPASARMSRELADLNDEIAQFEGMSIEEAEKIKLTLEEDGRLRESEAIWKDRLQQRERAFRDVVEQTEDVRQRLKMLDVQIEKWCKDHQFPDSESSIQWAEIFDKVEEAKTRIRRRNHGKTVCRSIDKEKEERENRLGALSRTFEMAFENSAVAVAQMEEHIQDQESRLQEKKRLSESIREYTDQIRSLQEKVHRFQEECQILIQEAQSESEEAFRSKGRAWQESRELFERLGSAQSKIKALVPNEMEREKAISAVLNRRENEDDEIYRLEEEIRQLEGVVHELYGQQAELNEQLKQLEEGGTYAQLLHQFEQKKDEFRRGARKWAVYRTAEHLLRQAKEKYRSQRLPAVISSASGFFEKMTGGRYVTVFAPEKEGFVVERREGNRFSPGQLSRGTREQLYLSLRLALARIYQSPSPYPMIMDDILVNFDVLRTKMAVEAIREAARHHQMFFFTCHDHLRPYFHKEEILFIQDTRDEKTAEIGGVR